MNPTGLFPLVGGWRGGGVGEESGLFALMSWWVGWLRGLVEGQSVSEVCACQLVEWSAVIVVCGPWGEVLVVRGVVGAKWVSGRISRRRRTA